MLNYILNRVFAGLITIWVASIISFIVIQLPPGDYVTSYIANLQAMGTMVGAGEAEALRIQYGLDQPMYIQYFKWFGLIVRGNFGMAMEYNRPVAEVIGDRMTLTVVVSAAAVIFIWALALPIGVYSAVRQYSILDYFFHLYRLYRHCCPQLYVGVDHSLCQLQILSRREYRGPLFARHGDCPVELG